MNRVLFVDDEPRVLDGLRRSLRGLFLRWEMDFAGGGKDALELLEQSPCDVVVADMRMPGMDGLELLEEISRRFPETVRMVLSGQCDRQSILRAVGVVHQFLNKPCEPHALRFSLERAFSLHSWLATRWQRQLVCSTLLIPSAPELHIHLISELQKIDRSIEQIGRIVSHDPGMTAKTLHLVGSGFFGTPRMIANVRQAATALGMDNLGMLAFSGRTFRPLSITDSWTPMLERLIEQSAVVAQAASLIAEAETNDAKMADESYLAGLLHDVGVLLMSQHLTRRYGEVLDSARLTRADLWRAENRELGIGHAEIGACVASLFGLPERVVEAIAMHHCPSRCLDRVFCPLTAVHAATVMTDQPIAEGVNFNGELDVDYLHGIGFAERLPQWREICRTVLREGVAT